MRRRQLVLPLGLLVLVGGALGCGGVPAGDALVITARCNDGTLVTSHDQTGCDSHGGADETYVGGPPSTKP